MCHHNTHTSGSEHTCTTPDTLTGVENLRALKGHPQTGLSSQDKGARSWQQHVVHGTATGRELCALSRSVCPA